MTTNVFLPNDKREDLTWLEWLKANVGEHKKGWHWFDSINGCYICFDKPMDATAFKIRFGL